jgi:hypothetical protein
MADGACTRASVGGRFNVGQALAAAVLAVVAVESAAVCTRPFCGPSVASTAAAGAAGAAGVLCLFPGW